MKQHILAVLSIIFVMVLVSGCTSTPAIKTVDPIIGSWQDDLGFSRLQFTSTNQFYIALLDDKYTGNWISVGDNTYQVNYYDLANASNPLSNIIVYDNKSNTIYLKSTPSILYTKLSDPIVGNWTAIGLNTTLMQFKDNNNFNVVISNSSFEGKWVNVNSTNYKISYHNATSDQSYVEDIVYDWYNNTLYQAHFPQLLFTKIKENMTQAQ